MRWVGVFGSRTESESRIPKVPKGHLSVSDLDGAFATKKARMSKGDQLRKGEPRSMKGLSQIDEGLGWGISASSKLVVVKMVGMDKPSSGSCCVTAVKSSRSCEIQKSETKLRRRER